YPQARGFCWHCFSNASCGLPAGGGTSLVAESGLLASDPLGAAVPPLPPPLPVVAVWVAVAARVVAGGGVGAVTARCGRGGWAGESPEPSPPQPEARRPIAMVARARPRITWSRRAPAGEARNTGSR